MRVERARSVMLEKRRDDVARVADPRLCAPTADASRGEVLQLRQRDLHRRPCAATIRSSPPTSAATETDFGGEKREVIEHAAIGDFAVRLFARRRCFAPLRQTLAGDRMQVLAERKELRPASPRPKARASPRLRRATRRAPARLPSSSRRR